MKTFSQYLIENEDGDDVTSYNVFPHPSGNLHQYTFPTNLVTPGATTPKIGILTILHHEPTQSMTAGWGFAEKPQTPITSFIPPTQTGPKQKLKDMFNNARAGWHVFELIKQHWQKHQDEFPNGFVHAGSGTETGSGENPKMDAVYTGLAKRAGIPIKKVSVSELKSTYNL